MQNVRKPVGAGLPLPPGCWLQWFLSSWALGEILLQTSSSEPAAQGWCSRVDGSERSFGQDVLLWCRKCLCPCLCATITAGWSLRFIQRGVSGGAWNPCPVADLEPGPRYLYGVTAPQGPGPTPSDRIIAKDAVPNPLSLAAQNSQFRGKSWELGFHLGEPGHGFSQACPSAGISLFRFPYD